MLACITSPGNGEKSFRRWSGYSLELRNNEDPNWMKRHRFRCKCAFGKWLTVNHRRCLIMGIYYYDVAIWHRHHNKCSALNSQWCRTGQYEHQRNNQRFIESTSDQESINETMMKHTRAPRLHSAKPKYQLGFYCRFFFVVDSSLIRRRSMENEKQ